MEGDNLAQPHDRPKPSREDLAEQIAELPAQAEPGETVVLRPE